MEVVEMEPSGELLRYALLSKYATPPVPGYYGSKSAGYDLCSAEKTTIYPHRREEVSTELCLALPKESHGRLVSVPALSAHRKVDVVEVYMDEGYRGVVKILVHNRSDRPFSVRPGQIIARLILQRTYLPPLAEVGAFEVSRALARFPRGIPAGVDLEEHGLTHDDRFAISGMYNNACCGPNGCTLSYKIDKAVLDGAPGRSPGRQCQVTCLCAPGGER
jgi:deoxyuridine 5'-triphosphate nucleotidohydrolase